MEQWKDIENYEGYYQVSNLCRVKSLDRIVNAPQNGGVRNMKSKVLSQAISKTGYRVVSLCKENKGKMFKVHRLIAIAFIENGNNLPIINHKNGNKLDNDISNLEWSTHKHNTNHAFTIGNMNNDKSCVSVKCQKLNITKGSMGEMAIYLRDNNYIKATKQQIVVGISNVVNKKRKQYRGYIFERNC